MAELRQCEFFVLRYVPDAVKQEFVNLGVVLLETGETGFTGVRFLRDWRRVRGLDPEADVALLESYERELQALLASRAAEVINYRGPMSRREWLLDLMQQSFSGAVELTPMQAVLTESPQAELGVLARAYLESERRAQREPAGRRAIYNAIRSAFEQAGVWDLPQMRKEIAVAEYVPGDPLKIDCGYLLKEPRVVRMYHAVALADDINAAKVLAFTYPGLRLAVKKSEGVDSSLTAITEDGLDLRDPAIAFALATLQERNIEVAPVGRMPQIAERARAELKL